MPQQSNGSSACMVWLLYAQALCPCCRNAACHLCQKLYGTVITQLNSPTSLLGNKAKWWYFTCGASYSKNCEWMRKPFLYQNKALLKHCVITTSCARLARCCLIQCESLCLWCMYFFTCCTFLKDTNCLTAHTTNASAM